MTSATDVRKIDVSEETGNWYPKRSDLRYAFVATIEVTHAESSKQVVSATSNLSRYGCHVRTATPFLPGTPVKLTIKHRGTAFQSAGKVVYAISGEGMGIHFRNVEIAERAVLKKWLVRVGAEELEHRVRESTKTGLSNREKLFLVICIVGLAALVAAALAWLGVLL